MNHVYRRIFALSTRALQEELWLNDEGNITHDSGNYVRLGSFIYWEIRRQVTERNKQ